MILKNEANPPQYKFINCAVVSLKVQHSYKNVYYFRQYSNLIFEEKMHHVAYIVRRIGIIDCVIIVYKLANTLSMYSWKMEQVMLKCDEPCFDFNLS